VTHNRVTPYIAGSNVDDGTISDSKNGSRELILQADFYAKGLVTADGILTKGYWKGMALDKFLLKTQPLARALETAWAQEMAVVAKEQAGANPEAAVPKVTAMVANEKACANLEAAVPNETAVVANEKAGANPEANVPNEKGGMARTNPEEAHAGLKEKISGERGT